MARRVDERVLSVLSERERKSFMASLTAIVMKLGLKAADRK